MASETCGIWLVLLISISTKIIQNTPKQNWFIYRAPRNASEKTCFAFHFYIVHFSCRLLLTSFQHLVGRKVSLALQFNFQMTFSYNLRIRTLNVLPMSLHTQMNNNEAQLRISNAVRWALEELKNSCYACVRENAKVASLKTFVFDNCLTENGANENLNN